MKIKNKNTGEIVEWEHGLQYKLGKEYQSIEEFSDDWEDYEEPNGYWFVRDGGNIDYSSKELFITERRKEIDNCFETKEEAEKAVEKLKAWKRLKDGGFSFGGYTRNHTGTYEILLKREIPYSYYEGMVGDIDRLFGGKECIG